MFIMLRVFYCSVAEQIVLVVSMLLLAVRVFLWWMSADGSLQDRMEDTAAMEMVVILTRRINCVEMETTGHWRKMKTNAGCF